MPNDSNSSEASDAETFHELTHPLFIGLEGYGSALDDSPGQSLVGVSFGYALRGGLRLGRWGIFLHVERNHWMPTELESEHGIDPGVFNAAIGGECLFADGFLRTSLALGTSTLVYDTSFDDAGTTGPFAELRPLGLRYHRWAPLVITLDPISLASVQPVVGSGPTIVQHEYRTSLGVEVLL